MDLPQPDLLVSLPDGRRLALDDRGDPHGTPVLYLHGTPDSRLARHPDDAVAARAGVRLLAPDRPGIGSSDPDPTSGPTSVADDLAALLDHLDIDRAHVLAWSAGSVFALALAGAHPDRVAAMTLVAPLVPADAYDDPGVLEGSGEGRAMFASALPTDDPGALGAELAPWLVPHPLDRELAAAHLSDAVAAVATVAGAGDLLVDALLAALDQGLDGVARDLAAHATPLGTLLDDIATAVRIHVGDADVVCPPAMARWLGRRLDAPVTEHAGAGHELAITHWVELLIGR